MAWKVAHADYKAAPPDPEDVEDEQDLCDPSEHMTMGKVVSLPWSKEKGGGGGGGGVGGGMGDGHLNPAALDHYRKQDFYTFCKVSDKLLSVMFRCVFVCLFVDDDDVELNVLGCRVDIRDKL